MRPASFTPSISARWHGIGPSRSALPAGRVSPSSRPTPTGSVSRRRCRLSGAVGCRTFFVAVPQEGFRVRQAAPDSTIYVLNSFAPAWGEVCRKHALRPVLGSFPAIEAWAKHAPGEPSAI